MKTINLSVIIFFLVFICGALIITSSVNRVKSAYKKKIGTQYILEKDTLTVVDYSFLSETFTLSDGRKVNAALIFYQENK